jgi:hypothetical protein
VAQVREVDPATFDASFKAAPASGFGACSHAGMRDR